MSAFGAKRTLGRPGSNDRFWRKADIRAQTETLQVEIVATMVPAFRADTCSTRMGHRQFPIHPTDITSVFRRMMAIVRKDPIFWSSH
jgi:hypothetical protein